jgi:Rieske Fe-S protein
MDRKEFIKNCGFACLGATSLGTILQGCATGNFYAKNTVDGSKINVQKTEFTTVIKGKTVQRSYLIIKNDLLNYPMYLYKVNNDTYSAVLMECTHNSCELHTNGEFLVCPCHGSEFSKVGIVQNPPAEKNLKTFKTTSNDETIIIYV